MPTINQCERCGACCAFFPVRFRRDTDPELLGNEGLSSLFSPAGRSSFVMNGTKGKNPRCEALVGRIGERVSCRIYDQRPSCCRDFEPAWRTGDFNSLCNRSRAAYGLPTFDPY